MNTNSVRPVRHGLRHGFWAGHATFIRWLRNGLGLATLLLLPTSPAAADAPGVSELPVRGIHFSAPGKRDLPATLEFIRTALATNGVNTLIIEFNYRYDFQSRPEFADPSALGRAEMKQLLDTCRARGIELIPMINCLGHQSWAARNDRLLQLHPEFDETPGKYPENQDIYCRSYCPLHPEVHAVLFDLIDELVRDSEAKAFHVGMDEVFLLADPDCPRCAGKAPADLFAGEVTRLRDHLVGIGCRPWIWGDRFLDAKATGLGRWEASENQTHPAIDQVPKDLVICDWHYNAAPDTAAYFARKGFAVVSSPWRKPGVALEQLEKMRALRADNDLAVADRAWGMLQTTWCGLEAFRRAYADLDAGATVQENSAYESANCFRELFRAMQSPTGH